LLIVLLSVLISAVGLGWVFSCGLQESIPAYCLYAFSAYALVILVLRLIPVIMVLPEFLHSKPLLHRYLSEPEFKLLSGLYLSLGIHVLYAAYTAVAGVYYRSVWFGALALYYIVLTVARFVLLYYLRSRQNDRQKELRHYRLCGWLLLILTPAISAIGIHTIFYGHFVEYPGFVIYAAAAYTFYSFSFAIVRLFRYKKYDNPIYDADRSLALAKALVSLFFLQTAMFASFGGETAIELQNLMNTLTISVVFLLVMFLAVLMIVSGHRKLKVYKK